MSAHTPPDESGREPATRHDEMKDPAFIPTTPVAPIADRVITRLRMELAELRTEVCRLRPALEQSHIAREEIARLRQAVESHGERLDAFAAKLETARAGRDEVAAAVARLDEQLPRVEDELRDAVFDLQDELSAREPAPGPEVAYRQLVRAIRAAVRAKLPRQAKVLVVGKADKEILSLYGRKASCFPQGPDGRYAGYYPACDTAAIAHLEALRAAGAEYLLFPEPSRWWLDHYKRLSCHLERRYRIALDQPDVCAIYALREPAEVGAVWRGLDEFVETFRSRYGREPAILDWSTGLDLSARLPDAAVFSPSERDHLLPYSGRQCGHRGRCVVGSGASRRSRPRGGRRRRYVLLGPSRRGLDAVTERALEGGGRCHRSSDRVDRHPVLQRYCPYRGVLIRFARDAAGELHGGGHSR